MPLSVRGPPSMRLGLACFPTVGCRSSPRQSRALSPISSVALLRRTIASSPPRKQPPRPSSTSPLLAPKLRSYLPIQSRIHVVPFQHDEVDKWLRFQSASLNPNFSLLSYFSSANEVYRKRVKKSAAPKAVEQIRVDPTYVPFWAITAKVSVNLEGDDSGQAASTGVETETFLFPGSSIGVFYHLTTPRRLLPLLPSSLRTFDSQEDAFVGEHDVQVVPFDLSPMVLPDLLLRAAVDPGRPLQVDTDRVAPAGVDLDRFDCAPIYFPFWVAQYRINGEEDVVMMIEDTHSDVAYCPVLMPNRPTPENPHPKPHHLKPSSKYMTSAESSQPKGMPPRLTLSPNATHPHMIASLAAKIDAWLDVEGRPAQLKKLAGRRGLGELGRANRGTVGRMVAWKEMAGREEEGEES